jgi:predicted nucleic acid-binding protein
MILVDSSVWIDFFRQAETPMSHQLVVLLQDGNSTVATADLVIFEVLRGFRYDRSRLAAQSILLDLPIVEIGGIDNALRAAEHDRALRAKGYTIRSPIDVLLASYCITHGHMLLHRDADFDAIETLRGLKSWPY